MKKTAFAGRSRYKPPVFGVPVSDFAMFTEVRSSFGSRDA